MSVKRPTNLLFANTAFRNATSSPLARTRKVRARVPSDTRNIGIFDISASAGLLFDLLQIVSRRQKRFTFYPVETSIPMGLGAIGDAWLGHLKQNVSDSSLNHLKNNIIVKDYFPFLKQAREAVEVDIMVGLFAPMLAFTEGEDSEKQYFWNYFSLGEDNEVAISVYGLRGYAKQAGRPFEAAVAILTLAQVWSTLYNINFHSESRGCLFDFCEDRDNLVEVIRRAELCSESLEAIPRDAHESVKMCLQAIRNYSR